MIENLIFGKSGFNTSVFEEHFISYSCILFIKSYALRSFCIKLLCFSKNCIFQIFDRSNLLLDRSKMRLKFWFELDRFNRCLIAFGSIKSNFWSIENRIESFFKTLSFHMFCHFQTFSKHFSLSLQSVKASKQFFLSFSFEIFARFFSSKASKTLLAFLSHLFSVFMH